MQPAVAAGAIRALCCSRSRTTSAPTAPRWASWAAGDDDARPLLEPDDDSIRVHSCHGRGRQVEVLRDAILHLLEDDPTLEPRDIIVMCPDIETFAPLIQATFGRQHDGDGQAPADTLEIRLADRSLRQTNPVMGVLAEVLELATARVTATEVLDLAGREPVRRRFRFSDEDLFRLEEWVDEACVRWGFDAAHRRSFQLEGIGSNTWQIRPRPDPARRHHGRRAPAPVRGTLPLDDVDSADIELAGVWPSSWTGSQPRSTTSPASRTVDAWADTLARISDSLTATSQRDAWQRARADDASSTSWSTRRRRVDVVSPVALEL